MISLAQKAGVAALSVTGCLGAESGEVDKGRYNLFDPTPRSLMRPLAADRPDKTESPFTVDAGHFQLEMDELNYTYDRHNSARSDTRVETVAIAPFNLKLGLCNSADLQFLFEPYVHIRTHELAPDAVNNQSGSGDMIIRTKVNFWGNDGGKTAFAMMPFIKLPANQNQIGNNAYEGGVILPLAVGLPRGWGMGLMAEVDLNSNLRSRGHHAEFVQSITFSHRLAGKLSGYAEFFSALSTESHSPWEATADCGLTYLLGENVQLDAGVNLGLTRSADDINCFTGISWRF
ncbi:MAG: hypothetical protein JWR69_1784 [Pedosphaera sp.]|nr:hypothetical protein [Pedosphaera sp.]